MTLIDFRKNPDNRSIAADLLGNPHLKAMIQVLLDEHPGRKIGNIRDGCDATLTVGRQQGFEQCLSMLLSLSQPLPKAPQEIKATWGAESSVE